MRRVAFAVFLALTSPALAVQPGEMLSDPGLEQRARVLSAELRCLVCQNQSIDDSDAPLARDLRVIVRERLVAGDSDDAIRGFLVQRYGDFILLRPPFKFQTLLLWLGPLMVLLVGAWAVASSLRRRRAAAGSLPSGQLSESERSRLDAILKDSDTTARN